MQIDLIGVPLDLGSERLGVDMAPNALRYQGFVSNLRLAGLNINDLGNIQCTSPEDVKVGNLKAKYLDAISGVCKKVADLVGESIKNSKKIIILGGDHSVAIGSVSGAKVETSGSMGLIWIDA